MARHKNKGWQLIVILDLLKNGLIEKMLEENKIYCGDCMKLMKHIPDNSVDMILCDLPYGTTACEWDVKLPFYKLWKSYNRILKDGRCIVLFSTQPFTSQLIMSNSENFKYEIIWDKVLPTGFATAKFKPMKQHENILVFSKNGSKTKYNPQLIKRDKPRVYNRTHTKYSGSENLQKHDGEDRVLTHYQPRSIIRFSNANHKDKKHPTEKPVDLCSYIIKTYTDEGDLVLDNCIGSGTTAVACKINKRNFIGIEINPLYVNIAKRRLCQNILLEVSGNSSHD